MWSDNKDDMSFCDTLSDMVVPDVLSDNKIAANFPDDGDEFFDTNEFLNPNKGLNPDMCLNF